MKGAGLQRVKLPPGNWFAPPGNNRSGGEGNQAVGAFGVEGHVGDSVSVQAVTRVNAEQARKIIAGADRTVTQGKAADSGEARANRLH